MKLYCITLCLGLKAYYLSGTIPTKQDLQAQFGALFHEDDKIELVDEPGFICFAKR